MRNKMSEFSVINEDLSSRHLVFYDWFIDPRAGGPTGYLANLRSGLDRTDTVQGIDINIDRIRKPSDFSFATPAQHSKQDLVNLISYYKDLDGIRLSEERAAKIRSYEPSSIHAHTAIEAVRLINFLKERNRVPLIFTSHCPESSGKEVADVWRDRGYSNDATDKLQEVACVVEALAFRQSDIWIFPSIESMEPYYLTIPKFDEWAKRKDVRFIETGASRIKPMLSRDELREKWGLTGKKVVSFIGRHNEVKGYDLLKEVGMQLLEKHSDLVFLIGGKLEGLEPLKHERWIELGWYPSPADIIAACDLFVLPNRMTYFDLITLEALSCGAAILASSTGGNKSVFNTTNGAISLFDANALSFNKAIEEKLWDDTELELMRQRSVLAYEQFYTPTRFAENYRQLIAEIYKDYNMLC